MFWKRSKGPRQRLAKKSDAQAMAELVNMAGEGLPVYLWTRIAEAGQDAWEVGAERARRESGAFSYRNSIIIEENGRAVALLTGYPLGREPEPIGPDTPPIFVPLQELENLAPFTWYVNVLAVVPEERGKGHGSRLLEVADEIAGRLGLDGLSIIVSDGNSGARRLYERCGYVKTAEREMVKEDWQNPGRNWVLMIKRRTA